MVSLTRNEVTIRSENTQDDETRVLPISPRLRAVLDMITKDPAGREHKLTAYVFGQGWCARQVSNLRPPV